MFLSHCPSHPLTLLPLPIKFWEKRVKHHLQELGQAMEKEITAGSCLVCSTARSRNQRSHQLSTNQQ